MSIAVAQPQVFARNPDCGLPTIQTFTTPACPSERVLQITKRVYITVTAGVLLVDFGNAMAAGFGASDYGRVGSIPALGTFNLTTDSVTVGFVRDITLAFDPFATDDILGLVGFGGASSPQELLRSFGWSFSAFLAGQVTIENLPFPTVVPTAAAIKSSGGQDTYWTFTTIPITTSWLGDLLQVTPVMQATHTSAPAPLTVYLPVDSVYRVLISVPNRAANAAAGPAAPYAAWVYVWTGVITITQENNTYLGATPVR